MRQIKEKRTAEGEIYKGLALRSEKRVEYLTIGCSKEDNINLLRVFERWTKTLETKKYALEYFVALVDENDKTHAHILWTKPYMRMDYLRFSWQEFSHTKGGIRNLTVTGNKASRAQMKKIVNYLIGQDLHHLGSVVSFYATSGWVGTSIVQMGVENEDTSVSEP